MTHRHRVKLVRKGQYAAEVDVELIDADTGWGTVYLSDRCPKIGSGARGVASG
jgi:hypothetical protein